MINNYTVTSSKSLGFANTIPLKATELMPGDRVYAGNSKCWTIRKMELLETMERVIIFFEGADYYIEFPKDHLFYVIPNGEN